MACCIAREQRCELSACEGDRSGGSDRPSGADMRRPYQPEQAWFPPAPITSPNPPACGFTSSRSNTQLETVWSIVEFPLSPCALCPTQPRLFSSSIRSQSPNRLPTGCSRSLLHLSTSCSAPSTLCFLPLLYPSLPTLCLYPVGRVPPSFPPGEGGDYSPAYLTGGSHD